MYDSTTGYATHYGEGAGHSSRFTRTHTRRPRLPARIAMTEDFYFKSDGRKIEQDGVAVQTIGSRNLARLVAQSGGKVLALPREVEPFSPEWDRLEQLAETGRLKGREEEKGKPAEFFTLGRDEIQQLRQQCGEVEAAIASLHPALRQAIHRELQWEALEQFARSHPVAVPTPEGEVPLNGEDIQALRAADDGHLPLTDRWRNLSPFQQEQLFALQQSYARHQILRRNIAGFDHVQSTGLEGVILSGNQFDLPPWIAYRDPTIHEKTSLPPFTDVRYATECLLHDKAREQNLPLLAVCGGMQLSLTRQQHPATGQPFTLRQHLPEIEGIRPDHGANIARISAEDRQRLAEGFTGHPADTLPAQIYPTQPNYFTTPSNESALHALAAHYHPEAYETLCREGLKGLSIHHQGFHLTDIAPPEAFAGLEVASLSPHEQMMAGAGAANRWLETQGSPVRITAIADDGIIEGFELADSSYFIAVQDHKESNADGMAWALVNSLVRMAELRREQGRETPSLLQLMADKQQASPLLELADRRAELISMR